MLTALNMTMPLKQDPESQAKLQQMKAAFADHIQPAIDQALRQSQIVHFARVLVIDDKYIQVLTEFDGDPMEYTEFFRRNLQPVFRAIFDLAEGVPDWDEINNQDDFFEASKGFNVKALGRSTDGREDQGWLFSYFGDKTVREIEEAMGGGAGSGSGSGGGGHGEGGGGGSGSHGGPSIGSGGGMAQAGVGVSGGSRSAT
ncbi:MAG TPA: hypothetical protein VF704_01410 [Allosphingosinicella sp.]|jgi:hypothetical protein